MRRISSDAAWLDTSTVRIDADGVPVDLTPLVARAPTSWVWWGAGTPALADFPHARVGDVIRRMSDGQEWRVDP